MVLAVPAVAIMSEVLALPSVICVLVKTLVCAGAANGRAINVPTPAIGAVAPSVVFGMVADLLVGVLTIFFAVPTNVDMGVEVLLDVNVNVFAGVMDAFDFAMPRSWEEISC